MKKLVISNMKTLPFTWEIMDLVSVEETASLFQKEYTPKAKDRLYIFPDCTIPRFKLKGLCEKYNLAISKTKEKANVLIGNPYMRDMEKQYFVSGKYHYQLFTAPFLDYLRKLPVSAVGSIIEALETLGEDKLLVLMDVGTYIAEQGLYGIKYPLYDDHDVDTRCTASQVNSDTGHFSTRRYKSPELQAEFESFVATRLYSQEAILKIINQGAAVIDESMYQSLRSMMSGSEADMQVAMEAMANSDIETSMPYLVLLYKEFGNELYDHPTKHHVNFKSLTTYLFLGVTSSPYRLSIDDCVDILKDKKVLTSKNMAILMKEAKQIIKEKAETEHFVITDVAPSEETQKIIDDTDMANAPVVSEPESPITAL